MFEHYHTPSNGNRRGDDVLRSMLFGGNGRKRTPQPAVPAMEQVLPQSTVQNPAESFGNIPCLKACSLAMVYAPPQEWQGIYPIEKAIRRGTLFSELDKPFAGKTLLGK